MNEQQRRWKSERRSPLLIIAVILIVLAAILWGAWLIVIPESTITRMADEALKGSPVKVDGLRKGLFYNVRADAVRVVLPEGITISASEPHASLSAMSIIKFAPVVDFSAALAGGRVKGRAVIGKTVEVNASARAVMIEQLGLPSNVSGGRGAIDADAEFAGGRGTVKLSSDSLMLVPSYIGIVRVPLDLFRKGRGMFRVEGRDVTVESFALEGEGIYARVKGAVRGMKADLTLEIMPGAEVEAREPAIVALASYKKNAGYYVIPIRVDLAGAISHR